MLAAAVLCVVEATRPLDACVAGPCNPEDLLGLLLQCYMWLRQSACSDCLVSRGGYRGVAGQRDDGGVAAHAEHQLPRPVLHLRAAAARDAQWVACAPFTSAREQLSPAPRCVSCPWMYAATLLCYLERLLPRHNTHSA